MHVQTTGAIARPTRTLRFGAGATPSMAAHERRSSTLSGQELRQIVAAMID